MAEHLRLEDVTVAYDAGPVLVGVSATVAAGEAVALIGPNGAGKSTLIKAILGLVPVRGGRIIVLGQAPARARADVGYVPQADTLDPQFPVSAAQVVLMGRYRRIGWLRRPRRADRRIAAEALERVGLAAQARRTFGTLSGGQRQRVLLARAIAQQPRLLLLDEPFNGVDQVSQEALLHVLAELRAQGTAVLISTHDLALVRRVADDAWLIDRQTGVVIAAVLGLSLYLGGAAAGVLAALAVTALSRRRGHDASTATAVALAAGFALGVALMAARAGFSRDLTAYLTGSILTVGPRDLLVAATVALVVGCVLAAAHKELLYTAFDPAGARASGYRTGAVDLLVLVLIELVVATAVPAVGTILTLALVVAPAGAARLWTSRIGTMTALATAIAVSSAIGGLVLSRAYDIAAGGAISLLAAAGFVLSMIAAPRH